MAIQYRSQAEPKFDERALPRPVEQAVGASGHGWIKVGDPDLGDVSPGRTVPDQSRAGRDRFDETVPRDHADIDPIPAAPTLASRPSRADPEMQEAELEFDEAQDQFDDAPPPRRSRVWPALMGFVLGVAVSQAFGFWAFMTTLIHGLPAPDLNVTAALVRQANPSGWQKISTLWERGPSGESASACVTLFRPAEGLAAAERPCPELTTAGLRVVPGVAPRNNRLALAVPLVMTFEPQAEAPVAGWAARLGTSSSTITTGAVTKDGANQLADADPSRDVTSASSWSTIAVPKSH